MFDFPSMTPEKKSGWSVFSTNVANDVMKINISLTDSEIYILSITAFNDDPYGVRWNSMATFKIFQWKLPAHSPLARFYISLYWIYLIRN